ncbi:hypothetical protein CLOM_g22620, partial [Closterium sp. NIES-68]
LQIRIRVPDLPTNEVFPTAASWTDATTRAIPATVATCDDGLRHGAPGRRHGQRRRPGRRRSSDEDGGLRTLSHNNPSRRYSEAFHLHRCSSARPTLSDHQRPRPKIHVQVLAGDMGAVRHTPPLFLRLPSSNRRTDKANQSNHGAADTHQLPGSCPVGRIPAHAGIFVQQCPIRHDYSLAVFSKLRHGSDSPDDYQHRQPSATFPTVREQFAGGPRKSDRIHSQVQHNRPTLYRSSSPQYHNGCRATSPSRHEEPSPAPAFKTSPAILWTFSYCQDGH